MSDKIINTFQQRRQLALAVAELAQTQDEQSLIAAAREIHENYPDTMIQVELLKNLETPDSQLRGGLGQLAALLPPEEIGPALRSIAGDRSQSSQSRLTAALLLSRFMGDPISPALLGDLTQSDEVALQSLREAVEEGKRNRHVLLEYVTQMREAGDHVAPMVLELLERLPEADRVELLRLIALDDREFVAEDALARLERLASELDEDAPRSALRGLHTLQFLLPPARAAHAERALRKLRFTGKVYRPPEPVGWRALMSIADLTGWQAIWFVRMPQFAESATGHDNTGERAGAIIYLTLNNHTGQIHALADEQMQIDELPPQQPLGQIVPVETDAGRRVSFLEAPFEFARWRLLTLLPRHWELASQLPPEFRLSSDLLFEFDRPEVSPKLRHYFQEETGGIGLPQLGIDRAEALHAAAAELLSHPAMAVWLYYNRSIIASLAGIETPDSDDQREALAQAILVQLEQRPESAQLPAAMAAGLRAQSAWFDLSGNPETARLVLEFAKAVPQLPISQNPLLAAVVEAELRARNHGADSSTGPAAAE